MIADIANTSEGSVNWPGPLLELLNSSVPPIAIVMSRPFYDLVRSQSCAPTTDGKYTSFFGFPLYVHEGQKENYKVFYNKSDLAKYLQP